MASFYGYLDLISSHVCVLEYSRRILVHEVGKMKLGALLQATS